MLANEQGVVTQSKPSSWCAVLDEVAPNQSDQLWKSLAASKALDQHPIIDIMAVKLSYKALKKWIPNLTRYRFSEARKHILIEGRGAALSPQSSQTRMVLSQTQLDHFLDFITSPHVIQDLPFGEKSIKLSSKEVIIVPNVIRMMVPESIVKQYLAYSHECGFTALSRRSLLRILDVCSASVRKSLQGLDYIICTGSQGFDDLCDVVNRLHDSFMEWPGRENKRNAWSLLSVI